MHYVLFSSGGCEIIMCIPTYRLRWTLSLDFSNQNPVIFIWIMGICWKQYGLGLESNQSIDRKYQMYGFKLICWWLSTWMCIYSFLTISSFFVKLLSLLGSLRPQSSERKSKWVVIRRQLRQVRKLKATCSKKQSHCWVSVCSLLFHHFHQWRPSFHFLDIYNYSSTVREHKPY